METIEIAWTLTIEVPKCQSNANRLTWNQLWVELSRRFCTTSSFLMLVYLPQCARKCRSVLSLIPLKVSPSHIRSIRYSHVIHYSSHCKQLYQEIMDVCLKYIIAFASYPGKALRLELKPLLCYSSSSFTVRAQQASLMYFLIVLYLVALDTLYCSVHITVYIPHYSLRNSDLMKIWISTATSRIRFMTD